MTWWKHVHFLSFCLYHTFVPISSDPCVTTYNADQVHSEWCGHRPLLISVAVYFYMLINNLFYMKGVRLNLLPIKLYSRMIEISWQYFSFLAC